MRVFECLGDMSVQVDITNHCKIDRRVGPENSERGQCTERMIVLPNGDTHHVRYGVPSMYLYEEEDVAYYFRPSMDAITARMTGNFMEIFGR